MYKKGFSEKIHFWKCFRETLLYSSDMLCRYLWCFTRSGLSFYNFRMVIGHFWNILEMKIEKFSVFSKATRLPSSGLAAGRAPKFTLKNKVWKLSKQTCWWFLKSEKVSIPTFPWHFWPILHAFIYFLKFCFFRCLPHLGGRPSAILEDSGYGGRPSAGRPKKISYEKNRKIAKK